MLSLAGKQIVLLIKSYQASDAQNMRRSSQDLLLFIRIKIDIIKDVLMYEFKIKLCKEEKQVLNSNKSSSHDF